MHGRLVFADDLIIKAAFDEMSVKESVFRKLDAVARQGPSFCRAATTGSSAMYVERKSPVLGICFS